jgi:hypothetical protein
VETVTNELKLVISCCEGWPGEEVMERFCKGVEEILEGFSSILLGPRLGDLVVRGNLAQNFQGQSSTFRAKALSTQTFEDT